MRSNPHKNTSHIGNSSVWDFYLTMEGRTEYVITQPKRNQSKVVRSSVLSSRATTQPEQPHNFMINATSIFYNGQSAERVYLGANLVWEKETKPKAGNFAGKYANNSKESKWWYLNNNGEKVSIAEYVDPVTKEFSVFVNDWKGLYKNGEYSFNDAYAEITAVPIDENTTTAVNMFAFIDKVTTIDLSSCYKDNITDVSDMFWYARFTNIHLGKWDMAKCTKIGNWFLYASLLTNVTGNLSNIGLNLNKNAVPNCLDFKDSSLTNASAMVFINGLATIDEANFDSNRHQVKFKAVTYDTLTPEQIAVATSKGWNVVRA